MSWDINSLSVLGLENSKTCLIMILFFLSGWWDFKIRLIDILFMMWDEWSVTREDAPYKPDDTQWMEFWCEGNTTHCFPVLISTLTCKPDNGLCLKDHAAHHVLVSFLKDCVMTLMKLTSLQNALHLCILIHNVLLI